MLINKSKIIFLILALVTILSCSKEQSNVSTIKNLKQKDELILVFEEAYNALDRNDP